jgi:hypothetical protein
MTSWIVEAEHFSLVDNICTNPHLLRMDYNQYISYRILLEFSNIVRKYCFIGFYSHIIRSAGSGKAPSFLLTQTHVILLIISKN